MSPLRSVLAASLLLLAFGTPAQAASLPGSSYDSGDGDQANGLIADWQGGITGGLVNVAADRTNDDCYIGGTKELSPGQWAFNTSAGGCVPGKSNVRVAFVQAESTASTTFAHFGMQRNSTTGNSFLTFELNQSAATFTNATGTTIPCRTNGDLLLSFDVGGSSLETVVYRWTGDGTGASYGCLNGANGTFQASGTIGAADFQGAMNTTLGITNYVNPSTWGATFPANSFGENAINLPAVLRSMSQSPCFGFVQMQVHTRSSTSISSAMIDTIGATPVLLQSCSATGTVYKDVDGDGTRDAGEPAQSGFTAYVDLDNDGIKDAGEPSGVTDSTGFYRVLDVPSGSFRVRLVAQPGWNCTQPSPCDYSRSWTDGGNQTGLDFGLTGPATASGTVFEDADADGLHDSGESVLAGKTFYVDYDDDGVLDANEPSALSDAFGAWSIAGVAAGTYRIRQVAASGWTCSTPAPCSFTATFTSGSATTGLEFGDWRTASIAGNLFEDANGDGSAKVSGETNLSGWQVYLDADNDGTFDLGETTTTTDASGNYSFTGLAPGAYVVRETLLTSAWYCASACPRSVTLTSGQASTGQDFGNTRYVTVSGQAYDDANADGAKGSGENGLPGVTVYVDYDGDSAPSSGEPSTTTDSSGNFTFTTVRAGSRSLKAMPYGAYKCTQPATTCAYSLTLTSGGSSTGNAFGENLVRSVSGQVFKDANANATKDSGETGLSGWQVYADSNGNSAYNAGEPTATTNGQGNFTITGMGNGAYDLRIVGQTGWTCDFPGTGASCYYRDSLGASAGSVDTNMDFGVYTSGTVSGTVFDDTNGDGSAKASGDAGLSGRTLWVDYDNDSVLDAGEPSATSASDGTYTITGVTNGTWTLRRQTGSFGFTSSYPAAGTWSVTLASNSLTGKDFGSYKPGSITGQIYDDADADGVKDSGEAGISGRIVYLDANNNGARDTGETSATTDGTGAYSFSSVPLGTARVREVVPGGWTQSAPATVHDLAVVSQSAFTGKDFGTYTTASISGKAYNDAGFDGGDYSAGAGDTLLSGKTIYLDADNDGVLDSGETSSTTDGSGAYSFSGLTPGTYVVRRVTAAATACSYPSPCAWTITVTSQGAATGKNFGTYTGATVTGTVTEDADADGSADPGDLGIAGKTVYLDADNDGTRDAGETVAVTDADGVYTFSGLVASTQHVRLDLPAGWVCESPSSPCAHDPVLSAGATTAGIDFLIYGPGIISGHLWTDSTGSRTGVQAFGDNDQPGRTVYLDSDDDGELDDGELTTTTGDDGRYSFSVKPGEYVIRELLPTDWDCSWPDPCRQAVTLVSGAESTDNDFSSYTTATITGTYYEDLDASGLVPDINGEDPGVEGRTVYVDENDNGTLDDGERSTVTDADGDYAFASLAPGSYTVRSTDQPTDWTCSYTATCVQRLSVEAGEYAQSVDFGTWTPASVSGTVFGDSDRDGLLGDGEAGRSGVVVFDDLDDDGTQDDGEPAATTATDGSYTIGGIDPGAAHLRVVLPSDTTCSGPSPCRHDLDLDSGDASTGNDFGLYESASVSGTAYTDDDTDGTKGSGENGLSGRAVTATPAEGDPITTTTGDDGTYTLAGLVPGVGYTISVEHDGETCSQPSDCTYSVTPSSGQPLTGKDFGLYETATVAGTAYTDEDADGTRDDSEPAIAGRTVTATPETGSPITTTTDEHGGYTLTGLLPGTAYTIGVDHDGESCSQPADCTYAVTPGSGEDVTGKDFGLYETASVTGFAYIDVNASGASDDSEPAIAGRTVTATPETGSPITTTTDEHGGYTLTGLLPGTAYTIGVDHDGESCSQPADCTYAVTPASGQDLTGKDFGLYETASVTGFAYTDDDASGGADDGEQPIAGRTVTATPESGSPVTATTDDDGAYALTGLLPGTAYVISVDHPSEVCSQPATCTYELTPGSGEAAAGRDFGLYETTAVTGTVFGDHDADGTRDDGEPAITGRTVTATPAAGDPITAESAGDGTYALIGLTPGETYVISVDHDGEACSQPSGCTYGVTPTSGQATTGRDFGLYETITLSGHVFDDADRSGEQDTGEAGIDGRTVRIDPGTPGDTTDDVTVTADADGRYEAPGLEPGIAYTISIAPGTDHSCSVPSGCSVAVTPTSGTDVTRDFGITDDRASIAGSVWHDLGSDGTQDTGDAALEGRTVFLDANDNGTLDGGERSTATDAHGEYRFTGLVAGTYVVRKELPSADWRCSAPATCRRAVTVAAGGAAAGKDFGIWRTGEVSGLQFTDTDGDGQRDQGEAGEAGWVVYVDADQDGTLDQGEPSATTAADGTFTIAGLRPGGHMLREVAREGRACTAPASCRHGFALESFGSVTGRDFGARPKPSAAPTVGTPTVTSTTTTGPPIVQRVTDDGTTSYEVPRSGDCTPLAISIPITDTTGAVTDVIAIFTPDDGSAVQTITLHAAGDGTWTGTLPCAADGELAVRYSVDGTPETRDVGHVTLIDPQGTIYDEQAYTAAISTGATAEEARCMGAVEGAVVVLQRQDDGSFRDVEASDAGILPHQNPERTGSDGGYRWDVAAGTYRVRVSHPGYTSAVSRVVEIPPAVTDLHVALERLPGTAAPEDRSDECRRATIRTTTQTRSCSLRPVNAWVRGSAVRRVQFFLDGTPIRTLHAPNRGRRFVVTVQRARLSAGAHRLTAMVTLPHGRTRTLRIKIKRCLTQRLAKAISGVPARASAQPFTAWLRGDTIGSVVYRLDGVIVANVRTADWRHRYGVTIDPRTLSAGRHELTADIRYVSGVRRQLSATVTRAG